jgi:hypothetical protein
MSRPHYEEATSPCYVDGQYQPATLTARGKRTQDLFEKTSKLDLWAILLQLAIRMSGTEDQDEALSIIEAEKLVYRQNGLI